jgi:hypothetical protein
VHYYISESFLCFSAVSTFAAFQHEVSRTYLSQVKLKSGIDFLVGFPNSRRIPTWRAGNGTRNCSLHFWSEDAWQLGVNSRETVGQAWLVTFILETAAVVGAAATAAAAAAAAVVVVVVVAVVVVAAAAVVVVDIFVI